MQLLTVTNKLNYIKWLVVGLSLLLATYNCSIELKGATPPPEAIAYVDNDLLLIGDHFTLYLQATYAPSFELTFPQVGGDGKVGNFEVIAIKEPTLEQKDGVEVKRQSIVLTIFEEGEAEIPSFTFTYKNVQTNKVSSIRTNPAKVTVTAPNVDLQQDIKPIKPPLAVPFSLWELLPYLGIGLVFLLLLLLLGWYLHNKQKEEVTETYVRPVPAHEAALQRIESLIQERLWQQDKTKAYYSQLTDIVREYIEKRFDIAALESTSDELVDMFKKQNGLVETALLRELEQLLQTADLVKFAKQKPTMAIHERSLKQATDFVKATKQTVNLFEEEAENNASTTKVS